MIATTPLPVLKLDAQLSAVADDGTVSITVSGSVTASAALHDLKLFVNGEAQSVQREGNDFHATVRLPFDTHYALHSRWRGPYGSLVMAQAEDVHGACAASYVVVGGV